MAAAAALLASAPVTAQSYSEGYTFIKAVKDHDGTKVMSLVGGERGTIVVNSKDAGNGDTALHIVARNRDLPWLSFLLGKGALPNVQNKAGETPLTIAAQIGWTEGADVLLARRAAVDMGNRNGETPLILAVHRNDIVMVRLLLNRGADPNKTDNAAGYSALDYARRDPRGAAIAKLLEAPRAAPRAVSGPGVTR
jgi:ankyrin repeat protein